jgi:homoserine dehydrogenase
MRVLLIGFGNVGRQVCRILMLERARFPGLADLDVTVVGIVTRSRGVLANAAGVDPVRALREVDAAGRFDPGNPDAGGPDGLSAARELEYDVLVELSTLSIEGRGEPAISHIKAALERGRHVVTANKGPIAFAYDELVSLARSRQCALLHESTVMDGAPVFNLRRACLRGCRIEELRGILNSTTNLVLSCMEEGRPLSEAVHVAQERGFAEADPRHDLEGWDAAAKISVLANAFMGAGLTPLDVEREGILSVTVEKARKVRAEGRRLRLLCRAWREGGSVRARVGLDAIPLSDPFASRTGAGGMLRISTDLMGPILVTQEEPTLYDTAYGVLGDLLTLAV